MNSYDLEIWKGSTFSLSITLRDADSVPINLSGYGVSGYARFRYGDSGTLVNLNPTVSTPHESGIIQLSINYTGTAVLPCGYSFYDIEIYNSGQDSVDKVLGGKVIVHPEASY